MEIKVKPVFVLDRRENVDINDQVAKATELGKELRRNLKHGDALLEDFFIGDETDLTALRRESLEADALLVYLVGAMPLHTIFQWNLPVVVFSGQYMPLMALYAFGVEQHDIDNLTIALDYQEIDEKIEIFNARKKLQQARIALFGFPLALYSRWHHLPDMEKACGKLGVDFSPVEIRELAAQVKAVKREEAEIIGERWMQEAKEIIEPSKADVIESACLYLAFRSILKKRAANAMAINYFELMSMKVTPPCYAMARLHDEGIPTACEMDVNALLTMLLLDYVADEPTLMGNIVSANPESNTIMISHCVVPTRMAGFNQSPRPYILRNYHGSRGVTAHVQLDIGQEVTIARLSRNLDDILIVKGELVDCRDTTACRTTITARVSDAREFIQRVFGNHHAVVYGDHIKQVKALGKLMGINSIEL